MSTTLTITVNKPDDTELEIEAGCGPWQAHLGEAIGFALEANGIRDGEWSSLVVTILPPNTPPKPKRPKLTIVRGTAA